MKKKILGIILALALLTTETFAWFLQENVEHIVRHVNLDYTDGQHSLSIESQDYFMEVYYFNGSEYVLADPDAPFVFNGMVPNGTALFKIRLKNYSTQTATGTLTLQGISFIPNPDPDPNMSPEDLEQLDEDPLNFFFVSSSAGAGYVDNVYSGVEVPANKFIRFSDKREGDRSLTVYQNLRVPVCYPGGVTYDDYVELNCYVWLDSRAGNAFQGVSLKIEHIIFVI